MVILNNHLEKALAVPVNPLRLGILAVFRKVESHEVALVHAARGKETGELVATLLLVFVAVPDFQLDNELLTVVSHHEVHATVVARLRLHVVKADAVNNRLQECEEQQTAFLQKLTSASSVP